MGATACRFSSADQFESEALAVSRSLTDVSLSRVRDAMAQAQGFDDAAGLLGALSSPLSSEACLEKRSATGELYFRGPVPDVENSWVLMLTDILDGDRDAGGMLFHTDGSNRKIAEGSVNIDVLGVDRSGDLAILIEYFCDQNQWPRGELFDLLLNEVLCGAKDVNSDVCEMLTDAYAAIIDGVDVAEAVLEDVVLWNCLGKQTERAMELAKSAYSKTAVEEAMQGLSLRGQDSFEAASGLLMERDFHRIIEAVFGTILMQSDPGCIDPDMMASYVKAYEKGMSRSARLSVFAGEHLLAD